MRASTSVSLLSACALLAASCELRPSSALRPVGGTAALAVRDDVVGWQEWGTEAHTRPFLERAYESAVYLEEDAEGGRARLHARLAAALADLLARHAAVDLFILVHGNDYAPVVAALDPALRARLRLVYCTGAGELYEAEAWRALGARAYVGHPGGNVAPLFYAHFLPRWLAGERLADAVEAANAATHDELMAQPSRAALALAAWVGAEISPESLWRGTRAGLRGDGELRASVP